MIVRSTSTTGMKVFSVPNSSRLAFHCATLRRSPDGKAERNLVHEIGKVVYQIEGAVLDTAHQISKEVAQGINRPADCDDEAHGCERLLHVLVHLFARSSNRA